MTKTEKEIVDKEVWNIYSFHFGGGSNNFEDRENNPDFKICKGIFNEGIKAGRKQLAEEIADMSCHDAPEVCQCCLELNEKLQKEDD